MSLFEFIGFIIVVLVFVLPAIRRVMAKKAQQRDPEAYARHKADREAQEKAALRRLLRQLGEEIPPELREDEQIQEVIREMPPPPRPAPVSVVKSAASAHKPPAPAPYARRGRGASPIQKLLRRPGSKRDMVLLREVLDRPVSMRDGHLR